MTPCEEKGYKVGDRFVIKGSDVFTDGSTVELYGDDDSDCPLFKLIKGKCDYRNAGGKDGAYADLDFVTPIRSRTTTDLVAAVRTAKATLDDARAEYTKAIDALREALGEGFVIVEAGGNIDPADGTLQTVTLSEDAALGEDMTNPANWRAGDVFEVLRDGAQCAEVKKGELVVLDTTGNDIFTSESTGMRWHFSEDGVTFHHRPNT